MSISAFKRFAEGPPPKPKEERCEMCKVLLDREHSHVVHVENRRLICSCRACYLLFAPRGAAVGKIRAVPDRYRHDPQFRLDESSWSELQIPVRTAFFFTNSHLGKVVSFYPSPAGATESLLALTAWQDLVAQNPILNQLEPDVEALLVHGARGGPFQCFLVPIDACYELVGRVRQTWRGFDGGDQGWREIDEFFAGVRNRSEVLSP